MQHELVCICSQACDFWCKSCQCSDEWKVSHSPAGATAPVSVDYFLRDSKATNPKDMIGSTKLPIDLVPGSLVSLASLAFLEGALKYGTCNWLIAGVRSRIYVAAALRHIWKWFTGEEADPKTKVPHLASAIACLGIIHDARLAGKLVDDRPPSTPVSEWIDEAAEIVKHLKELFGKENPRHYTIADTQPQETK